MMRIGIVTLGCDKNTVDNEYLAGLLERAGCELVVAGGPEEQLDAAVVTTCGFIDTARAQSVDAIVQLAERKRTTGNPRRLFVSGCLAQRYAEDLMKEIPEIDGLVGVGQFQQLADLILKADAAERADLHAAVPAVDIYQHLHRKRLDRRPHAFLKISDGCSHGCAFCSIPLMKGRHRSVPPEILLQEARELLGQGVREINLVAQDLSSYGLDRWKDYRLPNLLRDLAALEGDFWIRCLYHYPNNLNGDLLGLMGPGSKIVPYLDMPLQHLDPNVLKLMRRPFHTVNTFDLVARLRAEVPGLTLRTTMIVGFPGESTAAHRAMLAGIERLRFDRLGVFQYSREDSTLAAQMSRQVGAATREKRWHAVMALQAQIARGAQRGPRRPPRARPGGGIRHRTPAMGRPRRRRGARDRWQGFHRDGSRAHRGGVRPGRNHPRRNLRRRRARGVMMKWIYLLAGDGGSNFISGCSARHNLKASLHLGQTKSRIRLA